MGLLNFRKIFFRPHLPHIDSDYHGITITVDTKWADENAAGDSEITALFDKFTVLGRETGYPSCHLTKEQTIELLTTLAKMDLRVDN